MSTPPPSEIVVGDTWELISDLGVGLGAIPAGSQVKIYLYLSPDDYYSPTDDYTVVSRYTYTDWGYDETGNWAQIEQNRLLAYPEPDFRLMFVFAGGAE
ncbi:hypothetical protein ACIOHC_36025 [Streptomyces sp. NPDC088252]|uniref:hypothetical protein n=1 Tax=Streptomyces sp. NPDC088252 TaxID=3365845 RepID=UPI003804AA9B